MMESTMWPHANRHRKVMENGSASYSMARFRRLEPNWAGRSGAAFLGLLSAAG